jgi:hypothetical protein
VTNWGIFFTDLWALPLPTLQGRMTVALAQAGLNLFTAAGLGASIARRPRNPSRLRFDIEDLRAAPT